MKVRWMEEKKCARLVRSARDVTIATERYKKKVEQKCVAKCVNYVGEFTHLALTIETKRILNAESIMLMVNRSIGHLHKPGRRVRTRARASACNSFVAHGIECFE